MRLWAGYGGELFGEVGWRGAGIIGCWDTRGNATARVDWSCNYRRGGMINRAWFYLDGRSKMYGHPATDTLHTQISFGVVYF